MSKSTTKTYDENDTITIRSKKGPKVNFVQVSKEIVYNVGLSVLARQLLTILLSFPEYYTCKKTGLIKEWQIVDSFLMELLLCKRKKLQKAFKELRIAGYVTLVYPKKENGDFKGSHREFDYYPIFNDFEGTLEQEEYKTKIEKRKTHIINSNSTDLKIKEIINLGINEVYGEVIFGTLPKTTSEDNNNKIKNNINKKTDLDLRNSDHKSQSGNCIKTDKKSSLPNPLNSRELKTQPPKASPDAITASQPSTPKKDTNKVENAAVKPLQAFKNDKISWDKLPTDIHDAPIEERLDFINMSKAKIDGESFTPKELVARYGKDKLAMVWSDMKGFVAENPGKHVLNVAGLFLKRLRSTEAMLGSAPTQSA